MAQDEAQRQLDMSNFRISTLGDPTAANDATKTDNATAPANPTSTATAGSSFKASPADHVHQAVHSLHADAAGNLYGDVRLVSGTGITLSQSGQDITVSGAGATVNKITVADDRQVSTPGATEEIIAEFLVNLDDAGGATIQARLVGIGKAAGGTATFKLYVGATTAGATAGGAVRATFTTASASFVNLTNLGSGFANPGGAQLVQITSANSAANKNTLRGYEVAIG